MGHPSSPRLLVLHTLRLKGVAEAEAIASDVGLAPEVVDGELSALEVADLVRVRRGRIGGYALTPAGKTLDERLIAEELAEAGVRPVVEAAYGDFLEFNGQLLAVCTAWQLREVDGETHINDHSDPEHDRAVHDRLEALHERVVPVLDALTGALDRFAGHGDRLGTALAHVRAGDHDWFTKPMFPSYHSVWFELHEDLLATLGTERATESEIL
ncbi:transcriptional regulator [Actinospongicola halichondriae]|uniref:transcriptional regulator n=1 Tax=Actinospongicola halichondriae TaxID=3236844 RepID=UPI003D3A7208